MSFLSVLASACSIEDEEVGAYTCINEILKGADRILPRLFVS
jgi:hypothetical protein